MSTITAGHARACITPPLGIKMAGYGSRVEGARGVHDDLFVHALALRAASEAVVFLAYDVCLFDAGFVAALKSAVQEATGLEPAQVFVNTSHTHAGPRIPGPEDEHAPYRTRLIEEGAAVAAAALAEAAPARLTVGYAPVDIGCNRREWRDGKVVLGHNPAGPTRQEVTVWRFERGEKPQILLFSMPMHGTTLGGSNLELSAEWMGMARQYLEEALPNTRALFLQGCGADQDPYYSLEGNVRGTFAEVEAHGRAVANAVQAALAGEMRPLAAAPLAVAVREVPLPGKENPAEVRPLSLHGVRLGDAVVLTLSAEAFVEFDRFGREVSPAKATLVLGYTDGNIGYLCTPEVYAEGGYEANTTRVAPESEALVKEAMRRLLGDLMPA
ncbi:MAG: hypothetical protein QHJ73_11765 [Armatimonadota bacterium]|nr:hypothetical protein [Armatimonadota bacterium]